MTKAFDKTVSPHLGQVRSGQVYYLAEVCDHESPKATSKTCIVILSRILTMPHLRSLNCTVLKKPEGTWPHYLEKPELRLSGRLLSGHLALAWSRVLLGRLTRTTDTAPGPARLKER